MRKRTVKKRIFISNTLMVIVTLVIFLIINLFVIHGYTESLEDDFRQSIESSKTEQDNIDGVIENLTVERDEFYLVFGLDGILCIISLVVISQLFTKNLTDHIMEPLDKLTDGANRVKENNLTQPVVYHGEAEFENVCSAFNEMQSSILAEQEKNRKYEKARTDMIAGISHDLRTPLTAVRGTIKGLIDGVASTPAMQDKFLTTAYRRTGDMDALLNQLLYLSRMETGNMQFSFQEIEISSFLQNYVTSKAEPSPTVSEAILSPSDSATKFPPSGLKTEFSSPVSETKLSASVPTTKSLPSGLKTEFSPSEDEKIILDTGGICAHVSIDPQQFQRILDNLLGNSRKYAENTPLIIMISLNQDHEKVIICFHDNGIGVPEEKLPHIFEEFYRGDESRNKKDGNGLGLYIVKYLMNAMDGTVWAANEDGLSVYLELPVVRPNSNS